MQSLLALILSWIVPARGKRRAAPQAVPTEHTPTDEPTQRLIITRSAVGVGLPDPPEYLRGEDVPLIRPYLIAWEREQEQQRQRDRRTAAALATLGIDFHGVTA
ncbi:hypothetical protein [Streptomyces sp. WMMC905]|uniref:hypothetical protein n=1 Tax=Streptomyces sp. WMMC905 TaxID=3404123 RepID=UPI003B92F4ED